MCTFFFVMQHKISPEQLEAAWELAYRIVALTPEKSADQVEGVEYVGTVGLLIVPEDPALGRGWFAHQAEEIEETLGWFASGDTVHAAGQGQLVNAVNALARYVGCNLVESVTARESVDTPQPDGSVKKVAVFRFRGFRTIYEF